MNLPATRSTIETELSVLRDKLRSAPVDLIAQLIGSLMSAGLQVPQGIKADEINTVYSYALNGISIVGLKTAVRKFISGEYPQQSMTFVPTPPQLAFRAREEDGKVRADALRLSEKIEAMRPQKPPEISEEERERRKARILEKLAGFRAWNAERKLSDPHQTIIDEPLSPERAEMYRTILSMPDAREVTEEHRQQRRKITTQLEATQ